MDKFGVVNVQMHRLSQELRPLLHYYAVHPKVQLHCLDFVSHVDNLAPAMRNSSALAGLSKSGKDRKDGHQGHFYARLPMAACHHFCTCRSQKRCK